MKNILRCLILGLVFTSSKVSYSQQTSLVVHNNFVEKSSNSRASYETFSLSGEKLAYSIKYTGQKGAEKKDDSRIIRLTNEQLAGINNLISKYHLNVTDSLIDHTVKSLSYSITTTILITLTSGNKTSTIKVIGDHGVMEDSPLYINAAYLVGNLRQLIMGLH